MLFDFGTKDANFFKVNTILQILNSKRLLVDHVEILEECLESYEYNTKVANAHRTETTFIWLSAVSGAAVWLSSINRSKWTFSLLGLTVACGSACFYNWIKTWHYNRQHRMVTELIESLNNFEAAIRKNILFLHESQYINTPQVAEDKVYAGEVFRCLKEIIKSIHTALKALENCWQLDDKFSHLYVPMEELEDCDLFDANTDMSQLNLRTIKDIYNVFAYVQSQYLTRLGLSIASGASNLFICNLPQLTCIISKTTNDCLRQLSIIVENGRQRVARVRSCRKKLPPEVSNLRTLSLEVFAKLLNVVHQFSTMDQTLEDSLNRCDQQILVTSLETLENPLECIANDIVGSSEECQRLLVTVRKLINKEDCVQGNLDSLSQPEATSEYKEGEDKVYSEQDKPVLRDEFFAVDGTEPNLCEGRRESIGFLDDLEGINAKIVKRHFKPVLKQLRERIKPIGADFREREKRVLLDKGIDLNRLDEEMEEIAATRNLADGSDSEDEGEEARRSRKNEQRYDDMRGFLAAKEQMSLFALRPMSSIVNEDVLE
ncbi:uncharacterized protein LOC129718691 [Wyeomyia smithii]|uniref:uncharacterized protein LOC129718691 n=1 Tax=Wyeomyia smithii TaxID=174621 RepID=UPI002467DB77|nr:uncharacterized protein LOC129718691 [Wyeomyia smithii]XP_055525705.1 uncharacterized protein LOC129718691 [Wyeomyia smithii]XP_055525706.1 uncharacterized protein LOC129718691 [Wyeomyia smithii]